MRNVKPGTSVRYTTTFLRSAGLQHSPAAGLGWVTVNCDCSLCKTGRFVAVNEQLPGPDGMELLHINEQNVEKFK